MLLIQQGDTGHSIKLLAVSTTDHSTGVTGLSSATLLAGAKVSKASGALAAAAGTFTEIGNGEYVYNQTATEVNTLGELSLSITGVAGVDPIDVVRQVVAFNPYDAVHLGVTALPNAAAGANGGLPTGDASGRVTVVTVAASAINAASFAANALDAVWSTATRSLTTLAATGNANDIAAAVWNALAASYNAANSMGNILGNTSTAAQLATAVWASATRTLTASLDPSAAAIASAVFAFVTETNVTFQGFVRVATSALFGKSTNGGDTFRDFNDTKNRITGTVDALGNRTTMTTDQT